ncbi:flagellar assembly peptidoglycan hydrolase FlgJ [Rhodocyclus tenuis]|uniref:flagellar assembly peptidoglycan hydrolase FlgJ n=1 Tax=Rhodocyclus tenuis TaxID=1066 RepID=UPI00190531E7|nr:flagellar assembly peptidoglycan hydrolase FlgJ [Rhodocyclus tenuis]MBK1679989.1 flagellar assembly peptidoglycan hydrolase FlgJ [Rhodocyclus tenuis]
MKASDLDANRFVLDVKAAGDLRNKLKQDPQGGLKQAAQQFEGMLLQMMLKSMRDATPQDGVLDSDQTRFFTSIMDQQLAQNLSAQGKLGFAKMIEKQLGRGMASTDATSPTTSQVDASLETLQQVLLARQAAKTAAAAAAREATATADAGTTAGGDGREFVNKIWPQAQAAAASLGVPAQFLVAQAALESGWGKSEIRAADGSPSYNLFGVKAGRGWQGATTEVQTTEYVNGVAQTSREKFRVYGSYAEAFNDYASVLRGSSRFAGVLGQQDGTRFASALQGAGYATDPMYADKLSRIINGSTLRQALVG